MNSRQFLSQSGSPTSVGVDESINSNFDDSTELVNASFEYDLGGWSVGRDLPEDPNNSGYSVVTSVRTTTKRAAEGNHALQIEIGGREGDGAVWVGQQVDLSGYDTLSVSGFIQEATHNEILKVATYAGPHLDRDLRETDFNTEQHLADEEDWNRFEYAIDHDGPGFVAVGIRIMRETFATAELDDVRLE